MSQEDRDGDREREDEIRGRKRRRDEHGERRLGGVRDRRDRVRGEDRQRQELRQPLLLELARRQRPADQRALGGDDGLWKPWLARARLSGLARSRSASRNRAGLELRRRNDRDSARRVGEKRADDLVEDRRAEPPHGPTPSGQDDQVGAEALGLGDDRLGRPVRANDPPGETKAEASAAARARPRASRAPSLSVEHVRLERELGGQLENEDADERSAIRSRERACGGDREQRVRVVPQRNDDGSIGGRMPSSAGGLERMAYNGHASKVAPRRVSRASR